MESSSVRVRWIRHLIGLTASLAIVFSASAPGQVTAVPAAAAASLPELGPYRLHEWGTFTCLQDEDGGLIGGINTDDEPVPYFVHVADRASLNATGIRLPVKTTIRGPGACDRRVTMRLETPVDYFYPDRPTPGRVDLSVTLHGGLLSEFYPMAKSTLVFPPDIPDSQPMRAWSSTLSWPGLQVGVKGEPSQTNVTDTAWLTPRKVPAAMVQDASGEREHYVFYRGLGAFAPEFNVRRTGDRLSFFQTKRSGQVLPAKGWVVNVPRQGELTWMPLDWKGTPAVPPAQAEDKSGLGGSMHAALVAEGLTPEEATAMLGTWQYGYFKTPGTKIFYIATKAWVDSVLPLTAKPPPRETVRVMLGRIECVTPEQRALLKEIASNDVPDEKAVANALLSKESTTTDWVEDVMMGRADIEKAGIVLPPAYAAYLKLGRFRQALVLAECAVNPAPNLRKFRAVFVSQVATAN